MSKKKNPDFDLTEIKWKYNIVLLTTTTTIIIVGWNQESDWIPDIRVQPEKYSTRPWATT